MPEAAPVAAKVDSAKIAQETSEAYWAGTEVRNWLANPGHIRLKVSDKTLQSILVDAYGAGASGVRIGKPIKSLLLGNESSGSIIIQFPQVQKTRQKLVEVINKYWGQSGRDSVNDTGQDFEGLNLP